MLIMRKAKSPTSFSVFVPFPVPSGAPRQLKVRVVNSSVIAARWLEPLEQQDGRIEYYGVFYHKVDDQGNQLNPAPYPKIKYTDTRDTMVSISCWNFQK